MHESSTHCVDGWRRRVRPFEIWADCSLQLRLVGGGVVGVCVDVFGVHCAFWDLAELL